MKFSPCQGVWLRAVAVAIAAAACSSCSRKEPLPVPIAPVDIPAKLDAGKVSGSVDRASSSTTKAIIVIERQKEEIKRARQSAQDAQGRADLAYQKGLQAKSEEAKSLLTAVKNTQAELELSYRLNEDLTSQVGETNTFLEEARREVFELQGEIGRVESALDAQTQIANANKTTAESIRNALDREMKKAAENDAARKIAEAKARKYLIALWVIGALAILYVVAKIQARPLFP